MGEREIDENYRCFKCGVIPDLLIDVKGTFLEAQCRNVHGNEFAGNLCYCEPCLKYDLGFVDDVKVDSFQWDAENSGGKTSMTTSSSTSVADTTAGSSSPRSVRSVEEDESLFIRPGPRSHHERERLRRTIRPGPRSYKRQRYQELNINVTELEDETEAQQSEDLVVETQTNVSKRARLVPEVTEAMGSDELPLSQSIANLNELRRGENESDEHRSGSSSSNASVEVQNSVSHHTSSSSDEVEPLLNAPQRVISQPVPQHQASPQSSPVVRPQPVQQHQASPQISPVIRPQPDSPSSSSSEDEALVPNLNQIQNRIQGAPLRQRVQPNQDDVMRRKRINGG